MCLVILNSHHSTKVDGGDKCSRMGLSVEASDLLVGTIMHLETDGIDESEAARLQIDSCRPQILHSHCVLYEKTACTVYTMHAFDHSPVRL